MCFSFNVVVVFTIPSTLSSLSSLSELLSADMYEASSCVREKLWRERKVSHSNCNFFFSARLCLNVPRTRELNKHFLIFSVCCSQSFLDSHHHHHRHRLSSSFGRLCCCRYVCIFYHPFTLIPMVEILLLFRSRKKNAHNAHNRTICRGWLVWKCVWKWQNIVCAPHPTPSRFSVMPQVVFSLNEEFSSLAWIYLCWWWWKSRSESEREREKYENENGNSVKMPLLLITNNSTLNDDAAERESASECVVNTRNTTSNQEGSFN